MCSIAIDPYHHLRRRRRRRLLSPKMMLRPAPTVTRIRIPTFAVSPPNKVVAVVPYLQLPNFRSLSTTRSNAQAKYQHLSSPFSCGDRISRSASEWIVSYTDITMDGDQDVIISGIILSPGIRCGFSAPRKISVHAPNGIQDGELAAVIDNVDRILDKFPAYHKFIIHTASQNVIDQLNRVFLAQVDSSPQFESALKLKERLRDKVVVFKYLTKGENKAADELGKHARRFKPRTRIEYNEVDLRKIKQVNSAIDKYMCSWDETCDQAIKDGYMFLL